MQQLNKINVNLYIYILERSYLFAVYCKVKNKKY